ncbi:MAG: hypothetical protein RLZZ142_2270 [Verrucomicrobiota bacterium]|jgi:D-alanyl-D-alanine carboxypeptidase
MKLLPSLASRSLIPALCALLFSPVAQAEPLTAQAYIVMDHQSGHVLDSLNAGKKLPIASLTKIATATVVLDWAHATQANLDQLAVVPPIPKAITTPQGLNLMPGDQASLRDLLYAALLQSDNVAAETLAAFVGHTVQIEGDHPPQVAFIAQMNALARKLGMTQTRFLNPHGLDTLERKLPYSTAGDLAKLAAYAMGNSAFRFIVSQEQRRITIRRADGSTSDYRLRNTNELLGRDSVDGVKTGTTAKAGQCLVLSAARPPLVSREKAPDGGTIWYPPTPRRLQIVVLGSSNRFAEASKLLKGGWNLFDQWVAQGRPESPNGSRPPEAILSQNFSSSDE